MSEKLLSITFLGLSFLFSSCTDTGIFATIASSKKIEKGTLPENISAQKVMHISPDGENSTTSNYYFLHAGTGLYFKKTSGGSWNSAPISLGTEDGGNWDGVQSIVATGKRIFMVVYRFNGIKYTVGIQALDGFNGSEPKYTFFKNQKRESSSSSYQTIRLFIPRQNGDIYANILEYTGEYASLAKGKNNFKSSKLLKLNPDNGDLEEFLATQKHLDGTQDSRYVTSIAVNGDDTDQVIIAAIRNPLKASSGILLDGNGTTIEDNTDDNLNKNTPLTGLTWLEHKKAFIAAATVSVGGHFPVYASKDGKAWIRIGGSSSYKTSTFVDISNTTARQNGSNKLVLSGTYSHVSNGSSSTKSYGYNEIDVHSDDLKQWSLNTSRNSYQFANLANYSSAKLSSSSINDLTILETADGGKRLFASTQYRGLWSASLDSKRPNWTQE